MGGGLRAGARAGHTSTGIPGISTTLRVTPREAAARETTATPTGCEHTTNATATGARNYIMYGLFCDGLVVDMMCYKCYSYLNMNI